MIAKLLPLSPLSVSLYPTTTRRVLVSRNLCFPRRIFLRDSGSPFPPMALLRNALSVRSLRPIRTFSSLPQDTLRQSNDYDARRSPALSEERSMAGITSTVRHVRRDNLKSPRLPLQHLIELFVLMRRTGRRAKSPTFTTFRSMSLCIALGPFTACTGIHQKFNNALCCR